MSILANAIRNHIGQPDNPSEQAILATVDKCEAMRAESAQAPHGVGRFLADEFEGVICRELNVSFPAGEAGEAARLIGRR